MRLSHSESGKAGHHRVLTMLDLTCLGLVDQAWSSSSIACNTGCNSTPSNWFQITQGRSDSSTFFFFLLTAPESMDEARDSGLAEEQEELCDNLGELGAFSSLDPILPLLNTQEILRSC